MKKSFLYYLSVFFFFFHFHPSAHAALSLDPIDVGHLTQIELHGGSFWAGYFHCDINVQKGTLMATWDRRHWEGDGGIERHSGSKELSKMEMEQIVQSIARLQSDGSVERCAIAADGPEESLVLSFDHRTAPLRLVNQRSRNFVCGDQYMTDESFDQFTETLKGIYPDLFTE